MAGAEVVPLPPHPAGAAQHFEIDAETSCVVVQFPDFYGHLADLRPIAEQARAAGALLVAVVTEIVALGLLVPPGQCSPAIVVAEGPSLGNPLGFVGPHLGPFATRPQF